MSRTSTRRSTYALSAVLAVYGILLAVALLAPTSTDQAGMVRWLGRVLGGSGAPPYFTGFDRLEVLSNAAIVAPVSFLGSFLRPSYRWRDWTAWGFVVSFTVELVQMLLLPERHASYSDVVANTLGALLGAMLAACVFAVRPGVRR
jgi:VanZ family protein